MMESLVPFRILEFFGPGKYLACKVLFLAWAQVLMLFSSGLCLSQAQGFCIAPVVILGIASPCSKAITWQL